MNWNVILPTMSDELKKFVNREISGRALYRAAIRKGVGGEVRLVNRGQTERVRRMAREALRRRNLLV